MAEQQSGFYRWLNALIKRGVLVHQPARDSNGNETYVVKTPVTIVVKPQITKVLKQKYRKDREIGGILAAIPVISEGKLILKVDRVRFLRNHSTEPEHYYQPGEHWLYSYDKCLRGTWYKRKRIPIKFHSHPITGRHHSEYVMSYFNMATSLQDQKVDPVGVRYPGMKKTFYFPSSLLVVTDEDEVFLGVYGGHIAPQEFDGYMARIVGEDAGMKIKETISQGFQEGSSRWQKLGSVLLAMLEASPAILKPLSMMSNNASVMALANERIVKIQKQKQIRNYFDIRKEGRMEIHIPELEE